MPRSLARYSRCYSFLYCTQKGAERQAAHLLSLWDEEGYSVVLFGLAEAVLGPQQGDHRRCHVQLCPFQVGAADVRKQTLQKDTVHLKYVTLVPRSGRV